MAETARLGILGGSFDPIHIGHIAIAKAARDRLGLGRVLLLPNRSPPHKGVVAPPEDRLAMVRLAIRGETGLEASDREVRRQGPSFTIDTLREVWTEVGEETGIYFIIGSDSIPELPTWRAFEEIVRIARIVAVSRAGSPFDLGGSLAGKVPAELLRRMDSDAVAIDPIGISSTEIRDRVRRGLDLAGHVAPEVERYIREHRLYLEGA